MSNKGMYILLNAQAFRIMKFKMEVGQKDGQESILNIIPALE